MNSNIDNKLYEIIAYAIQHQLRSVILPVETTQGEVQKIIRVFMRKHPEIFWFSHQYDLDKSSSTLYFKYNFTSEKKKIFSKEIDNAVRFLFQPERLKNLSHLEKVAYVYKWIICNTTYNEYSSFNQTIYSVLINRNSVCTGYAKTAQYLLGLLGVESELVFGKFHADKSESGRHCWNIVNIDGDWYHVDFCLADPSLRYLLNEEEAPIEINGLLWNYFCKSTGYVLRNRSIENSNSYPQCLNSINKRFKIKLATPQRNLAVCKSYSGTTSRVYLDSFEKDSVIKLAPDNHDLIENEFEILRQLNDCKHVVKLKGYKDDGLLLELLIPWTELLNSHYYHISEKDLKNILIQLSEGLIECRDKGIVYSDIHYNNIFVANDGTFKWGDFGIAFHSCSNGFLPSRLIGEDGTAIGSRWFMSPETYHDNVFTESSAIYSLAMVAYFVMNDMRPPFLSDTISEQDALKRIISGNEILLPVNASVFNTLSRIVNDILNVEASRRIKTFEEFIALLNFDANEKFTDGSALENDSDACAATNVFPNGHSHRENRVGYDWDWCAMTCGYSSRLVSTQSSPKPAPSCSPDYMIEGECSINNAINHLGAVDKTTYSPEKSRIDSRNKKGLESRSGIGALARSAANLLGGLFSGFKEKSTILDKEHEAPDNINACLYAPAEVRHNKYFNIRVYMYMPHEQKSVDSKIKEIDPTAVKKEYKPLDLPVKKEDKITVQLELSEGVECKSKIKSVIWKNHYTDCSFTARLVDVTQNSIEGTAYVFVNDVPAGEMLFTIDVVDSNPQNLYTKVDSHRFSKIFISYSHQDEVQVRGIAEGCRMLGKDYFFDRHSLLAGDIFKDKIINYIDNADLFVLCWSKNAAESEWVQIEREHALRLIQNGKSTLSIYPICLRPEAPLPNDMSDKYNFGKL